jgi:PAS domain S-box-containing protein
MARWTWRAGILVSSSKPGEVPRGLPEPRAVLEAIAGSTTDAIYVKDADGRYLMMNSAGAEVIGRPVEEIVGRTDRELLPGDSVHEISEHDRSVMQAGEPLSYEERLTFKGGERVFHSTKGPYRDDEGRVVGVYGISRDITERETLRRNAAFLAETGALLESSLDYATTLGNVARLAIPEVADWCAVDVLGRDGAIDHVALAHADPDKLTFVEQLRDRYPPDPESTHGAHEVMRTGRSIHYPEIPDELLSGLAVDDEHLALIRSLGFKSGMIVPMSSRGRVFGAISFVSSRAERLYGPDDLRLAEEVGRRAGNAVENARLFQERSYIAQTLQRSLLPPTLPQIPGIAVAARFRAAGDGAEVGGDFYDLFPAADGQWAAVMGDVCGKGADAAAVTALARYTIRAAAMQHERPSRVLELLNDALLRDENREDKRFCTVTYALLQRAGDGVAACLACGGHPLPFVLRASGAVEQVGTNGTLLGIVPDVEIGDLEVPLAPGDTLVLYTDGVIEARGDEHPELGERGLAELLEGCAGAHPDEVAGRIEQAALEAYGGPPADDIAVLVLRVQPD